jgi:hypothetical protein
VSGAVGRARGDFSSDSVVPFTLTPIRGHDRSSPLGIEGKVASLFSSL